MPELPEVETVLSGLKPAMLNKEIVSLRYNREDLRFALPLDLPSLLEGRVITSMIRRGKYILCFVESGHGFVLHLGMSGVIKVVEPDQDYKAEKHDHVVFKMKSGATIVFNDPRRFGFLKQTSISNWMNEEPFVKMGPEPLGNEFNEEFLRMALLSKKAPIKSVLLDQRIVAGLGNIYVCEALFYSGVLPERAAGDLKDDEISLLYKSICTVLREAIQAGGSSLRDYRNTKGKMGYFQHHFAVYDREGFLCPQCHESDMNDMLPIVRIVQSGRSSFYCPQCQQ